MKKKETTDVRHKPKSLKKFQISQKENKTSYDHSVDLRESIDFFSTFTPYPNVIRFNKNLDWDEKQIMWFLYLQTINPEKVDFHWDSCRPDQQQIANFCNRSRSRIRPFIDRLIAKGYVTETKKWGKGQKRMASEFELTLLLDVDLVLNTQYIQNKKLPETPKLLAYIMSRINDDIRNKKLVVSNETTQLLQMRHLQLSQMGQDLDCIPELDLSFRSECKKQKDFSNEKSTHTRAAKSRVSKKWKRKGDGVEGKASSQSKHKIVLKDASHGERDRDRGIPPTPPVSKVVGNSKSKTGDSIKRDRRGSQGEMHMVGGKNERKGSFRSKNRVDNTEGLEFSKFKMSGRDKKPEKSQFNSFQKSKRPSNKVRDFQIYFQNKSGIQETCREFEFKMVEEMIQEIGIDEYRAVIDYACANWDELRKVESVLNESVNINQIIFKNRYQRWLTKIKDQKRAVVVQTPKTTFTQTKRDFTKKKLALVK